MECGKKRVFILIQLDHGSIDKYHEEFKALVAVVETYGGTFVEPGVVGKELMLASVALKQDMNGNDLTIVESASKLEVESATKIVQEKILALMLVNGANYKQYTEVHHQLANQFTQGVDSYPKTIKSTVRLLNNYKPLRPVQTFTRHR